MSVQDLNTWNLFLSGDKTAFEYLLAKNYRHLIHYGTKFTADKELVKDTIQELFINLWDKRANLSNNVNPQAYLTASMRRALYRKIQSFNRRENYSDMQNCPGYFDIELSIEEKLIEQEYGQMISHTIAQNLAVLPARQKEVVYLKYFSQFNRDGISEIMGISNQTVSNLLQMALRNLRGRISKDMLV
ncbi:MAG: sigma-70 family RNA polymerase sigma factor [Bacteroidota bacterium]